MSRRDDAPLDLLIGLLALQTGMVTRDRLVTAVGAWGADPSARPADLLVGQGALDPAGRDLLAALAGRRPGDPAPPTHLGRVLLNTGKADRAAGRAADAAASYREARAALEPVTRDHPRDVETRGVLVRARAGLALSLQATGRSREAASEFRECAALVGPLA